MGTNHYLYIDRCKTCGHPEEKYHIGKNSYGWKFLFHVCPEMKMFSGTDWINLITNLPRNYAVYDEYGAQVDINEMLLIMDKTGGSHGDVGPDGYRISEKEFS